MPQYLPHHIHLMSHDAMATGAWYEKMFGAELVASQGANGLPRANMKLGDQIILISTVTEDVTQMASGPHSVVGLDHIGIAVDDLHAAINDLEVKGCRIHEEATTRSGQNRVRERPGFCQHRTGADAAHGMIQVANVVSGKVTNDCSTWNPASPLARAWPFFR